MSGRNFRDLALFIIILYPRPSFLILPLQSGSIAGLTICGNTLFPLFDLVVSLDTPAAPKLSNSLYYLIFSRIVTIKIAKYGFHHGQNLSLQRLISFYCLAMNMQLAVVIGLISKLNLYLCKEQAKLWPGLAKQG
jgi:hypothetical protein